MWKHFQKWQKKFPNGQQTLKLFENFGILFYYISNFHSSYFVYFIDFGYLGHFGKQKTFVQGIRMHIRKDICSPVASDDVSSGILTASANCSSADRLRDKALRMPLRIP